jgi:hypothetical protein
MFLWSGTVNAGETCPPTGYARESLIELKQNGFMIAEQEQRDKLAVDLMGCLADPDPALRDGVAFEGVSTWMRGQQLSTGTVLAIYANLLNQVQDPSDANGFQQPFAALMLAEVARVDRLENVLSPEMRGELVDVATRYLTGVTDYRGFSDTEGWRHGVAHGSDLVVQLVLNPNILPPQIEQLMGAVASQIAPAGAVFYVYGEPGRLARAAYYAWSRGIVDDAFWNGWFAGITNPRPMDNWGQSFASQSGLAKRNNTLSFLLALHFNAILAEDESGQALARRVMQTITEVSGS